MDRKHVYCKCGSTHCICDDGCVCSPVDCQCLICKFLKAQNFNKCAGELLTPLDNFPITGRLRRDLDKMHDDVPQRYKKCNEASNYPQKYEADDDLIFQMDDIDDPPEKPKREPASSNVRGQSGCMQPSPNITISNPRQSRTREGPIIYDCDCLERCHGPKMLRDLELQTETLEVSPSIFCASAFHSNESRVTGAPTTQIVLTNSELNPTAIISTPEDSKVTENPITEDPRSSELNPSINISILEDSKATKTPITQDHPKSSELNPGKILNPGELQTDVSGEELSPSNMYSSETLPSDLSSGDSSDDSQSSHSSATKSPIKIISTSAPALFDVPEPFRELESPPKQDTSDVLNPPGESTTNLPRIETILISDSQSTAEKIPPELDLSTETISTDIEASTNDLPEPFRELEPPPKQETSDVLNPPGESTTNLPRIETLLISDSQSTDEKIPPELESPPKQETSGALNPPGESTTNLPRIETILISDSQSTAEKIPPELGLSIETISTDAEANANDLPPLYFTVSPSVLTATTTEVEPSETNTAAIPDAEGNFLKMPSPEFSQHDSKKK